MDTRFEEKLKATGITDWTPIQTAVAEPMANGASINALAPTGTGKTLAFTWPILPTLVPEDGEQLLVLAPSQELAMQTTRVMREWATVLGLRVLSVTGGANVKNQLDRLKKHPEVIVGTPGRVSELVRAGKLKLHRLRTVILDEADELLREETAEQIEQIWRTAKDDDIQVALFGATAVDEAIPAKIFDREFETIDQRDVPIPTRIKHEFWLTANDQRNKRLRQLASQKNFQAMVFFNTTKQLKNTANFLAHEHIGMATLVRGDSSSTREKAMRAFREGKSKFLLTTDVGARGLDIPGLPAVINFDLPRMGETYTHRAGRTGRMSREGVVISFGNDHDLREMRRLVAVEIEQITGQPKLLTKSRATAERTSKREGRTDKYAEKRAAKAAGEKKVVKTESDEKPISSTRSSQTKKFVKKDVPEVQSREERFAQEKKAKRKHRKNKGKPKPKN
ncbi:DEAD/DEAH box helicase [Weissella ceti]|uniref:DEAD/DEAH box helicase n=1 Tax=Weissella ceti TaxID=759620 RepID=UPI001BCEBFEF|nr:DEAD/DEAH box helicase [Weissella ceti]QVK11684.1 DEAD/DEAH box helicase [Weissella ceti]